jgi:glutamyl-tRNA(Gln) amidotransferase subunit E
LDIALEIALTSGMNIVGEVHITRKQYLDGSIPTGFQRTAIVGIGGEIPLKNKTVRLIQMSVEEDSCREVSDIGHQRVFRTDRLGMPLIETVTYPDMKNPDEVKEACDYIRFLNRSTGKVRTGIGAGREDVNVSCAGGSRVEIKGVSRTKWIPELTHVEAFRQWALLAIREELTKQITKENWKMQKMELNPKDFHFYYVPLQQAMQRNEKLYAVNLPKFGGLLSHFTQPAKPFYDEFTNRLKVIACIEKPNMATNEDINDVISVNVFEKIQELFNAGEEDAQIIFWAPEADVETALITIEERALLAFDGVPNETRKSFVDGTTIFERVLPGADRMYPDTDSAPIPIPNSHIENLRKNIPDDLAERFAQLVKWGVPKDCYNYIFTHNYFPLIKKIVEELNLNPKFVGVFFGQVLKHRHGKHKKIKFSLQRIYDLFAFLQQEKIEVAIVNKMLKQMFLHPKMDFESILAIINYKKFEAQEIEERIPFLSEKFIPCRKDTNAQDRVNALMGQLRAMSEGNVNLAVLAKKI